MEHKEDRMTVTYHMLNAQMPQSSVCKLRSQYLCYKEFTLSSEVVSSRHCWLVWYKAEDLKHHKRGWDVKPVWERDTAVGYGGMGRINLYSSHGTWKVCSLYKGQLREGCVSWEKGTLYSFTAQQFITSKGEFISLIIPDLPHRHASPGNFPSRPIRENSRNTTVRYDDW